MPYVTDFPVFETNSQKLITDRNTSPLLEMIRGMKPPVSYSLCRHQKE